MSSSFGQKNILETADFSKFLLTAIGLKLYKTRTCWETTDCLYSKFYIDGVSYVYETNEKLVNFDTFYIFPQNLIETNDYFEVKTFFAFKNVTLGSRLNWFYVRSRSFRFSFVSGGVAASFIFILSYNLVGTMWVAKKWLTLFRKKKTPTRQYRKLWLTAASFCNRNFFEEFFLIVARHAIR